MDTLKIFTIALLLATTGLRAQEATPMTIRNVVQGEVSEMPRDITKEVWVAEMPAGKYVVRLTAITSVSMHEYLVDGTARIFEVNIGTKGSELVRFYYIEPNTPSAPNGIGQSGIDKVKEKLAEGSERLGADQFWQKVVKNYPTTTHAHTVEYRVGFKETLVKLYESVEGAWLKGEGKTFKP